MRLCIIAIAMVIGGSTARADFFGNQMRKLQGGALLHYEVTGYERVDDTGPAPAVTELVLAGARLHGFIATGSTVAYHIGIDLAAGGTIRRGGFAYDVALFPVGVAVRFGRTSFVTAGLGVGAIGATGTLDDAVTLPLEVTAEVGGGRLRLLGRARASYVAGADSRHNGAPSIAFADELDAMLGVRLSRRFEKYAPAGNGYFIGVAYRELAGSRFAGLTIGYSIDGGTPRKPVEPEVRRSRQLRDRSCGRDCILLFED